MLRKRKKKAPTALTLPADLLPPLEKQDKPMSSSACLEPLTIPFFFSSLQPNESELMFILREVWPVVWSPGRAASAGNWVFFLPDPTTRLVPPQPCPSLTEVPWEQLFPQFFLSLPRWLCHSPQVQTFHEVKLTPAGLTLKNLHGFGTGGSCRSKPEHQNTP